MNLSNYLLLLSLVVLNVYAVEKTLPNGLTKEDMISYRKQMRAAKTIEEKIAIRKKMVSSLT